MHGAGQHGAAAQPGSRPHDGSIGQAGSNAEQMVALVELAAERANPGWWKVTESPYPNLT